MNEQPSIINNQYDELARLIKGEVFTDIIHRAAYSSDASIYQIVPACVVYPRDTDDVSSVVKFAATYRIPVAARGAGSGVAGESLCSGILLDTAKYMNKILESGNEAADKIAGMANATGSRYETVTCEPGVVLDELNNFLAGYGRKFGPDPSTANRATIGGCVANNATGAHSLQFGYSGDYVELVEAVLADGTVVELVNDAEPQKLNENLSRVARKCIELLTGKEQVIKSILPATKRNRAGYNIAGAVHDGKIDLARLMTGSEGTLVIFTKIRLRTVPLAKAKGLLQLEFDSLDKMAKGVPLIVESGASACELMDNSLIAMAVKHLPEYKDVLPVGAAAALLVEHTGRTPGEVEEKIKKTQSVTSGLTTNHTIILDEQTQKRIWKARKDAVPLLERGKGRKRPVPFIEDVSVENKNLGEYITGLAAIGKKYDVAMSCYGHAGDGELHIRPYLDLGEQADIDKMVKIANDVFALAWSLGGTISGEHAVGLVRAAFLRRQYGDEFYNLLCEIKKIFDPQGILNPGKIISGDTGVMVKNLKAANKVQPEKTFEKTGILFEKDEISNELEQCSGCGVCRGRESQFRMCPIFRATGDELATSRAKMNVLRFWSSGQMKEEYFESPEFRMFLDLCVNCQACKRECPAGVDVSKIMASVRAEYVRLKGLRLTERILGKNRYLSILGCAFAPVSNFIMRRTITKWLLEKALGLDRRRPMPRFSFGPFLTAGRDYLSSCQPNEMPIDKVAYFVDTYVNYNDHELGFAVINVLQHNDIEVILPKQRPAPLPAIVYGDVKTAKKDLAYSVKHLASVAREGYKIICSEPSAAMCLKQELRHYVGGKDASIVSANTYELMEYLLDLLRRKKLNKPKAASNGGGYAGSCDFVYHTPCHLFATGTYGASIEILKSLCGLNVTDLKAGCCGLAGTFGMQKKNYELSDAIAASLKKALDKTDAQYVLTECAACAMQIEHISNKRTIHPIKVLAECYKH